MLDARRTRLQENLRQLCVFQLAKASGKSWLWWDYVTRFGEQCTMANHTYDEDCAEKVRLRARYALEATESTKVDRESSCPILPSLMQ